MSGRLRQVLLYLHNYRPCTLRAILCWRSGLISKLFDTMMVFLKEFFENVDFEKKNQQTQSPPPPKKKQQTNNKKQQKKTKQAHTRND